MPTEQKPLKERIAALKAKRAAISREAKVRVASAYTVAKTIAPKAPESVQGMIAAALLTIPDTKVLTAAVKQTAVNNFYTHIAEQLSEVHKLEMNDLLEKPDVLSKLKSELETEMKGGATKAAAKTTKKADDRSECGVQPETYTDPSIGITPPEIDASKAGEREPATVDKTLGDKDVSPKAAAKTAGCTCGKAGCEACKKSASDKEAGMTCAECKDGKKCAKHAAAKKADEMPPAEAPAGEAGADHADEAPAGDEGADLAPAGDDMGDVAPETEGEIVIDNEKKEEIKEEIDAARNAIETIQTQIDEAAGEDGEELLDLAEGEELNPAEDDIEMGDDALDLENIFSDDNLNEHKGALANEHEASAEEITFDNEPTSADKMEAALEGGQEVGDASDFFASDDDTGSSLDLLFASAKEAAGDFVEERVKDKSVVESFSDAADHFQATELGGEEVDAESDHDEDIFGDVLKSLKREDYNVGKAREQEPDMKSNEPIKGGKQNHTDGKGTGDGVPRVAKAAAAKPASKTAGKPIRRLKVSSPVNESGAQSLSRLLFTDEDDYK